MGALARRPQAWCVLLNCAVLLRSCMLLRHMHEHVLAYKSDVCQQHFVLNCNEHLGTGSSSGERAAHAAGHLRGP